MKAGRIYLTLAAFCLMVSSTMAAPLESSVAEIQPSTSKIIFTATLHKKPPFKPVFWEIAHADNGKLVEKNQKQSFVLHMAPGRYVATAKLNGTTRYQYFSVMANNSSTIALEMSK